jgi:general secretion pathway protein E
MGIEPFLVASSLVAIVAQRLIRFLCQVCREPYTPIEDELKKIGIDKSIIPNGKLYRSKGCGVCLDTGYSGRTGIFEILVMNDDVRNLTLTTTDSTTIKRKAIEHGMTTLKMDGANKILRGLTSVDEVLRVAEENE